MADFSVRERLAEKRRKRRIQEAIDGKLYELSGVQRCAQCDAEFVPLRDMNRLPCAYHPLCPVESIQAQNSSADSRLWDGHYPCCTDYVHISDPVSTRRTLGCLRADHSVLRVPDISMIEAENGPIRVDLWKEEGLANYVHIEPLFIVEKIAEARGTPMGAADDLDAIFGPGRYKVVSQASWISAHKRRKVILTVGPLRLEIDARQAYVRVMEQYRLPHQIIKQNFVREDDGYSNAVQLQREHQNDRRRLQTLLNAAFSTASGTSATTQDAPASVVELDKFGYRVGSAPSSRNNRIASGLEDEYYDADKMMMKPHRQSNNSDAHQMARDMISSVASSEEAITFYPFVIWTWASSEVILS